MVRHFTYGDEYTYFFKDVHINEKFGNPIYLDGVEIGGILVMQQKITNKDLLFFQILGIEIKPEFRRKGYAKEIIMEISTHCDAFYGVIVEEDAVPFWKSLKTTMIQIPSDSDHLKGYSGVKRPNELESPIAFFKTFNIKAKEHLNNIYSIL